MDVLGMFCGLADWKRRSVLTWMDLLWIDST